MWAWPSPALRVTLRVGAARRFLAPPSPVPGRGRLMGRAEKQGGVTHVKGGQET